jgi:hypothetical protein
MVPDQLMGLLAPGVKVSVSVHNQYWSGDLGKVPGGDGGGVNVTNMQFVGFG